MRRRDFVVGLALAAQCGRALAAGRRPLIAALDSGQQDLLISAFLDGMREHGYVEGKDFDFVLRSVNGDYANLVLDAEGLAALKPDVILAVDPTATIAVKKATSTIAIVAPLLVDPVAQGQIASYAHPGGNLTGVSIIVQGLWSKVIEIVHELIPGATTIGLLLNPDNPAHMHSRPEIEAAAAASSMKIVVAEAAAKTDLERAFKVLLAARAQAVIAIGDRMFIGERARIADSAVAARLPLLSNLHEFVQAGGLMSYGVNSAANERRAAYFVDKILHGSKPADLPVEFPTQVDLVVNLKTARSLGIAIPPSILLRANEVIE
jgi:putative tryptophan/tyrosine transport system substrate-binding protein